MPDVTMIHRYPSMSSEDAVATNDEVIEQVRSRYASAAPSVTSAQSTLDCGCTTEDCLEAGCCSVDSAHSPSQQTNPVSGKG
jgi:hypothetical protein